MKTLVLKGYQKGQMHVLLTADMSQIAEFHEIRCMIIDDLKNSYDRFETEVVPNEIKGFELELV